MAGLLEVIAGTHNKLNRRVRGAVVAELRKRDGSRCWYCGSKLGARGLPGDSRESVEHLIPTSLTSWVRWQPWNLVLAHQRCNSVAGSARLAVKFALRDTLRELGGWGAFEVVGGTATLLRMAYERAGEEPPPLSRAERRERRRRRRRKRRWRENAPGHPGAARRPLVSLGELAGMEVLAEE